MARQPSKRKSWTQKSEDLNLTSILDMVTTIMFFLLMFANVIPVVIIDAPRPKIAETAQEIKQAKEIDNKFDLQIRITNSGFVVTSAAGSRQLTKSADNVFPYKDLHKFLVSLKGRTQSKDITLMPDDDVRYEIIITTMDASRQLAKDDPGYAPVPPEIAQKPESLNFNQLFPNVSIGGV